MFRIANKSWTIVLLLVLLIFIAYKYLVPIVSPQPHPKPAPITDERVYEYYVLIDEESGEVLGHVSSVKVTTGDEYVSGNNKRYVVTKVEENRAYMRDFGPADGGKDRKHFKDKTD